jgi:excisionase family DNA binding protein
LKAGSYLPNLAITNVPACGREFMKTDKPKSPPKFYTIEQIAECVETSTRTVRRWIKDKLLTAHRINGVVRISKRFWHLIATIKPRPPLSIRVK